MKSRIAKGLCLGVCFVGLAGSAQADIPRMPSIQTMTVTGQDAADLAATLNVLVQPGSQLRTRNGKLSSASVIKGHHG